MVEQITMWDLLLQPLKIVKPIRLIELFAGYGSVSMAFERLGIEVEHYRVVEFDNAAITSFNAVHGTDFPPTDILNIRGGDLGIEEKDKYTYILMYSFPCTDLSVAGKRQGMEKGSGTRSGLLWEVERLLNETEELPDVLLMENVTQVHGTGNQQHFSDWVDCLKNLGYTSYYMDMNGADYGVAQHRERTFMVSILGEYNFKFPEPMELNMVMADYLDDDVDEKYYVKSEKANELIQKLKDDGTILEDGSLNPNRPGIVQVPKSWMMGGYSENS